MGLTTQGAVLLLCAFAVVGLVLGGLPAMDHALGVVTRLAFLAGSAIAAARVRLRGSLRVLVAVPLVFLGLVLLAGLHAPGGTGGLTTGGKAVVWLVMVEAPTLWAATGLAVVVTALRLRARVTR